MRTVPTYSYIVLLIALLIANVVLYKEISTPRALTVSALEVGEGSATLVHARGMTILIDTGPDASILRALGTTLPPWQRSLNAVILTSDKKASVGGLTALKERYRVAEEMQLTRSERLALGDGTYIDLDITRNAPAGVSVFDGVSVTKIR